MAPPVTASGVQLSLTSTADSGQHTALVCAATDDPASPSSSIGARSPTALAGRRVAPMSEP
eukprot:9478082-Pyramimonas_sp.AAC.1